MNRTPLRKRRKSKKADDRERCSWLGYGTGERPCRNLAVPESSPNPRFPYCRRHIEDALKRFEEKQPALAWYLRERGVIPR